VPARGVGGFVRISRSRGRFVTRFLNFFHLNRSCHRVAAGALCTRSYLIGRSPGAVVTGLPQNGAILVSFCRSVKIKL
jgi:hypothetical protein